MTCTITGGKTQKCNGESSWLEKPLGIQGTELFQKKQLDAIHLV